MTNTNIKNVALHIKIEALYLINKMGFVSEDGIVISIHTNTVRKHLFLVIKKGVSAEIVCKINFFVNNGSAPIAPVCNDAV